VLTAWRFLAPHTVEALLGVLPRRPEGGG
jgi:hypothetical protein